MTRFELEKRDGEYGFPCSLCKNNNKPAIDCHNGCGFYNASPSALYDLENDIKGVFVKYEKEVRS